MRRTAWFLALLMISSILTPLFVGPVSATDADQKGPGPPLRAGHIEGYVLDDEGSPIQGATVTFDGGTPITTDSLGFFSAALPGGSYNVKAARAGYADATVLNVTVGDGVTIHLMPRGWMEAGDEFLDGAFDLTEVHGSALRLAIADDPLLPVDEWFFAAANDYFTGSNWNQRNASRGNVWYVDINGDGSFDDKNALNTNFNSWEVAVDGFTLNCRGIPVADFDNDGDYDLVVPKIRYNNGWYDDTDLYFVENLGKDAEGHRVFAEPVRIPGTNWDLSAYMMDVAVDDFNEDGNWDFIAAGNNDNLRYLEGNGDGTFTRHTITNNAPGSQARGKAAGDVNNDGHADLVMTERSTGKVYAYLGDGTGSFSAPIYLFTTYSEWWSTSTYRDPYGLAVADFNNDGSVDIITNDGSPGLYSLWIGDGALNFTRARTLFDFSNHGSLDPFDIDRDGDMDFIVIENYYGGRIYSATNWEDGTIWTTKQIIAYNSGSSGHRSLMAVSTPPSQPTFETSGTYVSSIHDTGDAQSRITHVIYEATDNANQTVTVQVRSSNNPSMMGASPWETVDPDDNTLSTPAGQYIQYRVILTSTKRSTPVLESMRIRYQTNPSWITGQVENTGGYVVADAEVSFWTGGLKVARDVTDGSGNYRIGVSPGTYTLRVQCKDYNPYRESVTIVGDAVNDMEISYRNFIEFTHPADFAGGNFTNTTLDETHDALALATNMALDRPVFSNRSSWANWDLHYLVDGTITRRFHATVNAGAGTGYMNPQWVAVDLGDQVEIAAIDYYMSYDTRFWQSGFRIAVYTDYDAGTKTFSGETIIVDYPKGTWTSAEDCPNRFVFEDGAIFQASNGGNVSGWLPGTSTVTGRYVKVFNVYGNYSNSDLWHYYRIAELSVFAPSMSGEYISAIWNVTDDDRQVSAVQWHSDVPAGTSLSVSIRTGETVADLLSAPWTHVTNRQYGFTPPLEGQFIQYRVQMTSSDGTSTPRLRDIMLFAYEHPAWISGNVTHAVIGTSLPLAGVTVQQDAGLLLPFTILTDASGYYLAPVEYPTTGYLDYTLNVSKNGFRDGTGSARITPASVDITLDIQLDAGDDWTEMWGNPEHTSSTFLPSNIVAQGVSWKAYIGGYAGWGVIADVNLDNRNDIVMLYGDRVVAKTPDDVLLWVGETSDVDRIIGIYDLDKNGIIDIVAAKRTPARISIINGLNGSLEYEVTWPTKSLHQYAPDNIVVDDFDGSMDGKYEMIIKLNDGRLRAWTFKTVDWRAVPETMWDIAYTYDSKNSIAVGDVDLDGVKDVVVLTPYRITVYNAEDGSFKYDRVISSSPYRVGGSVVIRDINASDGRGNIIVIYAEPNNNWYRNNDLYTYDGVMVLECNSTTIGLKNNYVVEKGGWGNQILWEWMEGSIADVDGDGRIEFVGSLRNITSAARVAGLNHWYTLIIDLESGTVEHQFGSAGDSYNWETRGVVDIDGDPQPEIILQSGTTWVALDGNATGYYEKWNETGLSDAYWNRFYKAQHDPTACWFSSGQYYWRWYQVYGPNAYGDIDGDGMNEIFLTVDGNITAYDADGAGLNEKWRFVPPTNQPMPNVYMRDIGNLTGDDVSEATIVTDDGYLYIVQANGSYRTVRTGGSRTNIWVADMNGDGIKEILAHLPHETWLTVFNASGADYHNEPVSTPLHHLHQDTHFLVDYDGDDRTELITKSWSSIYCYEWTGDAWSREWRFRKSDIWNGRERLYAFNNLLVGNFNGDDVLDIYFRYNNYSYSQPSEWSKYVSGSMVLDGRTHSPIWVKDGSWVRNGITYDVDNDGLDEIVSMDGRTFKIFDPLIGEFVYQVSTSPTYSYGGHMVGNADQDVWDELLVGKQYYSSDVIGSALDIITGEALWYGGDENESTYRTESAHGVAADVDGDGLDEVIQTMLDGRAYCIDDDGTILWKFDVNNSETVFSPPSAADMDSDGIPEILFGASDGYMYVLDGNNGTIDWTFHFGFGSGQPVIVDVDDDGEGEVLISVGDGYIYCIDNVNEVELILREKDVESVVNQPDGNTVTIGVDVRNEGGIRASNVTVRFTDNGVVFEEVQIDIGPGSVHHLDVEWISTPVGNHTINISVDPDNRIPELDETNNNFTRTIYVWPVPDMAISNKHRWEDNPDVTFGLGPFLGRENRLEVTIHNLGPVLAENFYVNLSDNNRTVDSQLVTLGAYENGTYSLYWTPRSDPANFTHTLEIWIDKDNRIFESDELNNHVILSAVTFGPPPEIEIRRNDIRLSGNIEMPDDRIGVIEGEHLIVNCTLRNRGFLVAAYVGVLVWIDINRDRMFREEDDVYINLDPLYTVRDRWSRSVEIIPSRDINKTEIQFMKLRIDTAPLRAAIIDKTGSDDIVSYPLSIKVDPTDLIPERDNLNYVNVGDLLIIPTQPEVSIVPEDIKTDFMDTTVMREEMQLWIVVRNLGASRADNVTVELMDLGVPIGTEVVDVPAVSHSRPYGEACTILRFNYSFSSKGEHVFHVRLTYDGEEAQTVQENNDAELVVIAVEKSVAMRGLEPTGVALVGLSLLAALLGRRRRDLR